jgi:hypothetical protein
MGEVVDEAKPRPFHERFDIDVGIDEARQRFINRVSNLVLDRTYYGLGDLDRVTNKGGNRIESLREVASALGDRYRPNERYDYYVKGDFRRCLKVVEALYKSLGEISLGRQRQMSEQITEIINSSETDIGVRWEPPVFFPTGAVLLDEHVVNEPLRWLAAPKYKSVRQPFEKGLSHYLEAQNRPDRLADVVTDMYEAVEALAKIVTGRSSKTLCISESIRPQMMP